MSEQAKDSYEAPSVEQVDAENHPSGTAAGLTDTSDQAAN
jgi:hypothetical protein